MLFISLLIAATIAIAGSAAYFSVYGLAFTFSGVFWSVVVMGASLEAGKLVAASYLYRYWAKTHIALKVYLLAGIAALMALTSGGIFGYLSTGYQQDVLPLKQKTEQVELLTEERVRAIARKKQIDDLLAGGPAVNTSKSDANTARVLREATRSKETTNRQFREEQQQVTKRITELDSQLLTLRQELIKVEAHIGPITYIAKAFDLQTDDATKYLIFLIIFAFDPMAIALTLCVNIALRLREEEKKPVEPVEPVEPDVESEETTDPYIEALDLDGYEEHESWPDTIVEQEPLEWPFPEVEEEITEEFVELPLEEPTVEVPPTAEPIETQEQIARAPRTRAYPGMWNNTAPPPAKVQELINYHKSLQAKIDAGEQLSKDEIWEKQQIEDVLRRHNLAYYL